MKKTRGNKSGFSVLCLKLSSTKKLKNNNYLIIYSLFFIFCLACIDIHAIKNITEYCDIYDIFEFRAYSYDDLVEELIFKIWCFINSALIAVLFYPKEKRWLTFVSRLLGSTIFFFTLVDLFCIYELSTRLDLTKFLDFTGNTNGDSFYFIVNYLSFPQVQICLILFA